MKIKFCMSLITLCSGLALAGCGGDKKPESSNETTTKEAPKQEEVKIDGPTYTMAVERSYPPFVEPNAYGVPSGFDIDLIKAIGVKSKFNVNVQTIDWKTAFDGLQEGKYQILGSGVGINEERQSLADFSDAYLEGHIDFATTSPDINTKADVTNLKIAVQAGTFYEPKIIEQYGKDNTILEFDTFFLACYKVIQGEADVCVEDHNLIQYFKSTYEDDSKIKRIHTFEAFDDELKKVAFAVTKDNTELTISINNGLKQIKADGTYDEIYQKWFGE